MASVFFDVTDLPTDFGNADTAEIVVRTRGVDIETTPLNLFAQLFRSDESTPLSNEVQVAFHDSDSAFANSSPIIFTGLDTAADKTIWDAARIRFRWVGYDPADLEVVINESTAELSWSVSPTPGVVDYQVFRRTPQTGEPFDPEVDTPVVTAIDATTYEDEFLSPGDYDWQVFGRIGEVGGGGGDPPSGDILWQETFESVDVGTNRNGDLIGPTNSTKEGASIEYGVTDAQAHSGTKSLYVTLTDAVAGTGSRHRLDRQLMDQDPITYPPEKNLPDEHYISAWFYVPTFIQLTSGTAGWNIYQFKESDTDGSKTLKESVTLWDLGDSTYGIRVKSNTLADGTFDKANFRQWNIDTEVISAGEWFSIETYRKWVDGLTGVFTVWINGVEVFNENLWTEHNWPHTQAFDRQFTVNSYCTGTHTPNTHTLYIDDVVLATARQT